MRPFRVAGPGERIRVLCLGAHSDDIEIGAGGTILELISSGLRVEVLWCVLSALGPRKREAEAAAESFLDGCAYADVAIGTFKDGYFPYQGADIKSWIEDLKTRFTPDIVFTHRRDDAHQDHREVCNLTWNTFRDHVILEYEIPKWDGDLGRPNTFIPIQKGNLERKIELLGEYFGTQRSKDWFDAETFRGLARLRGMECRAPEKFAEAFLTNKLVLGL
jgi:LmbE family N-acetylglucosaminyl deacetylase